MADLITKSIHVVADDGLGGKEFKELQLVPDPEKWVIVDDQGGNLPGQVPADLAIGGLYIIAEQP